jgi:hypothetical protein
LSQAARVCIERTFDVPQAAAGPLVTPTKPIFSTLFAASAEGVGPARIANPDRVPNAKNFSVSRLSIMMLPL